MQKMWTEREAIWKSDGMHILQHHCRILRKEVSKVRYKLHIYLSISSISCFNIDVGILFSPIFYFSNLNSFFSLDSLVFSNAEHFNNDSIWTMLKKYKSSKNLNLKYGRKRKENQHSSSNKCKMQNAKCKKKTHKQNIKKNRKTEVREQCVLSLSK